MFGEPETAVLAQAVRRLHGCEIMSEHRRLQNGDLRYGTEKSGVTVH